jgi:uncharacterized membrane protein
MININLKIVTWRSIVAGFLLWTILAVHCVPAQAAVPQFGENTQTVPLRGRVIAVENLKPGESVSDLVTAEQLATVEITRGQYQGMQFQLRNSLMGHPLFDLYLTQGRQVILWGEVDQAGRLQKVYLQDFARDTYLHLLVGLFVLVLLLVGRRKGLTTVFTIAITVYAIFFILLPLLLTGYSPIGMTILVASGITLVTMLFVGGLHWKSAAAFIGTVGGVLVAGLLSLLVGSAVRLTGFSSEEAQMLLYMDGAPLDVRGLLFAGIIISSLGAVMDVAMSIAATMHELYRANPRICFRELFRSVMNVGHDVMGTMANTLILAYVGSTLPLLLMFMGYRMPWVSIVNSDLIATEVVRALAGSIGLVATIPLTALVSGLLLFRVSPPQLSRRKSRPRRCR